MFVHTKKNLFSEYIIHSNTYEKSY